MSTREFEKIVYTNWTAKELIELARATENLEAWTRRPPPDLEMLPDCRDLFE